MGMVEIISSDIRAAERDVVEFLRVFLFADEHCVGAVLPTLFSENDERRYGGKWGLIAKKLAADEEIRIARPELVFKTEDQALASASRLNATLGISDDCIRAANRNQKSHPKISSNKKAYYSEKSNANSNNKIKIFEDVDNLYHYVLFSVCAILAFVFTLGLNRYEYSFDLMDFLLEFIGQFIIFIMIIYAVGFSFSIILSIVLFLIASIFDFDPKAYRGLKGIFDFFVNPITGTVFFLILLGAVVQFLGFDSDGCTVEYSRGGMTCG